MNKDIYIYIFRLSHREKLSPWDTIYHEFGVFRYLGRIWCSEMNFQEVWITMIGTIGVRLLFNFSLFWK